MLVVGVTGRSGSGKTTVARHYAAKGYPVVDGDAVARELDVPGGAYVKAVAAAFGSAVVNAQGSLNRRKLAEAAFADEKSARRLANATHPLIVEELLRRAEKARAAGASLFFVDGAVIVGAPFGAHCDRIVVVRAPHEAALLRIMERDTITQQQACRRLASQRSEEELVAAADWVIYNDGDLPLLLARADAVLQRLCEDTL